jgi:hypothetical protein
VVVVVVRVEASRTFLSLGVWLECDNQHVAEAETHQLRDHGLQSMGTSPWNFTLMSTLSTPRISYRSLSQLVNVTTEKKRKT